MNEGFNGLPNWAKGTVAVLVVGTIVTGGFLGYGLIKKFIEGKSDRDLNRATTGDLKDLNKKDETKQTISKSQSESFASGIYSALDGNGSDEGAVESIFKSLVNEADVLAIIKSYGTRTLYGELFWRTETYTGDLAGSLRDELSSSELNKINNILASKNINFRF